MSNDYFLGIIECFKEFFKCFTSSAKSKKKRKTTPNPVTWDWRI